MHKGTECTLIYTIIENMHVKHELQYLEGETKIYPTHTPLVTYFIKI